MTQIKPLTAGTVYSELLKKENVAALATAPDSALAQISALKTREESGFDKYQARSKVIAGSVIPSYLVARGVSAAGSLGTKLTSVAGTAAGLGVALSSMALFTTAENFITKKSEKVRNFKAEHPTVSGLTSLVGCLGSMMVGDKIFRAGMAKAPNLKESVSKFFSKIDSSKFATQTLPKAKEAIKNVIAKAPKAVQNAIPTLKSVGKTALKAAPWLLIGVFLIDSVRQAKKENKIFEKNMTQLANAKVDAVDTVTEAFKI